MAGLREPFGDGIEETNRFDVEEGMELIAIDCSHRRAGNLCGVPVGIRGNKRPVFKPELRIFSKGNLVGLFILGFVLRAILRMVIMLLASAAKRSVEEMSHFEQAFTCFDRRILKITLGDLIDSFNPQFGAMHHVQPEQSQPIVHQDITSPSELELTVLRANASEE